MFTDDILACTNVYDIMAICYKKLCPYHNSKVNDYDSCKFNRLGDIIAVFYESNNFKKLKMQLVEEIYTMNNPFCDALYFFILSSIDANSKFSYPKIGSMYKIFKNIKALNANGLETRIYILPRMHDTIIDIMEKESSKADNDKKGGLRKRSKKQKTDTINFKLNNYVIYSDEEYCPSLYVLTDSNNFANRIKDRKALNIGLVPLMHEDIFSLFNIDETNKDTFSITAVKSDKEALILEAFTTQLSYFKDKDVDIIILPEMYLTDDIISNFKKYIHESMEPLYCNDIAPKLIVAGTHWKNCNNTCYVIDNRGSIIYKQNKFEPYLYNDKLEDLKVKDFSVNILDVEYIGRLFTFICKDISNGKLHDLFLDTFGDVALYTAYSPSLDITYETKRFTSKCNCISVFSNACGSRDNKREIGFCSTPWRDGTESSAKISKYGCMLIDQNNCDQCKSACIFSIEYENIIHDGKYLGCNVSKYNM
jgi:predicted amidohydrolase